MEPPIQSLLHDDVGDDLAVGRGLEDGAAAFKLLSQLAGVRQIAVVRERHAALEVVHQNGLDVALVVAAGRAVAHMADGDGAPCRAT